MTWEAVAAVTSAVTALVAVPVTLVAAHWTRRSTERAADTAMVVGLGQSEAAVRAARLQGRTGREHALESDRRAACTEFLRAADLLVRTVRELPASPLEERREALDRRVTALIEARAGIAVLGPADVSSRAQDVLEQCMRLERLALRRAVLRSAVDALERHWCSRCDPEVCEDPHHGAAFAAWDLLAGWGRLEDEERWEKLDFLEWLLEESRAFTADKVAQVLQVAESVAHWDEMMGGLVRDPLLEGFHAVRDEFAAAACGSLVPMASEA
ncbi:hypothetical protein [Streptomyces sp. NPDC096033]|uniref:hypothetical protein n=1 Tax=Streptomyces sp. NPDC096033 TaxID=3366071 RepID=UPI0037F3EB84